MNFIAHPFQPPSHLTRGGEHNARVSTQRQRGAYDRPVTPSTDTGRPLRFHAPIYKLAMNYCVDVPTEVGRALGGGTYVPVEGAAAGEPLRTRLTPRGGGEYRLFLSGEVRAAAGVGLGDEVAIELRPEEASREVACPDDLAAALATLDRGLEAFAGLTEAQRTSMIAFVERARTPGTRARYVARVVDSVRGRLHPR